MRNLFKWAVLGTVLIGLSGCGFLSVKDNLDPKAMEVYGDLYDKFVESGGDLGAATVWRMRVEDGLTPQDVEESLASAAMGTGLLNVGSMPLSEEIAARTGEEQRFLKIYQYCNPMTARKATDFSPYFSAYLPCRISLVEDEEGVLWLYSLNMDMFVHGGRNMPPEFKEEALHVRNTIWDMMEKAAAGAF
ncbi:MAG: DUF302 domain-containing protein [Halothiobacillaceae bacterium]